MDVVVAMNSDRQFRGGHLSVSGVEGVYSGDVLKVHSPRLGSFVPGGGRQLQTEAIPSSEAEAEKDLVAVSCYSSCLEGLDSVEGSEWIHGFQEGDMVWGKVKSHPWWPGYIFNEFFCPPSVCRTKREGHVLVAFFGDNSYGWFDPVQLLPFDLHFPDKSKQSTSRNFLDAVNAAVEEVSRRGALGLSCCCRNSGNFRNATAPGYLIVDILGYESNLVYSKSAVVKARDSFVPVNSMSFVSKLAVAPCEVDLQDVYTVKMLAIIEAFRKANHEGFVGKSTEASGLEEVGPQNDHQGIPQQSTIREPRATPPKKAPAASDDRQSTNKCIFQCNVGGPAQSSSPSGASPKSPRCPPGDSAPKSGSLHPSPVAIGQPTLSKASSWSESSEADSQVSGSCCNDDLARDPREPEQDLPLHFERRRGSFSPVSGEFRPKKRHGPTDSSFVANKDAVFKMKRPRENGRTPSSALGLLKEDAEEDTHREKISDDSNTGSGGSILPQKRSAAMPVGVRSYPAGLKLQSKLTCGEESPTCISVSRAASFVPPSEQVETLMPHGASSELAGLVADLKALAVNLFHGESMGVPFTVRRSFLRYRSKITRKNILQMQPSSWNPKADGSEREQPVHDDVAKVQGVLDAVSPATTPEIKESQLHSAAVLEEPRKAFGGGVGKKRAVWERAERQQEDNGVAKKAKTVAQMKALAAAQKQREPRKVCVLLDDAPTPPVPLKGFGMKAQYPQLEEKATAVATPSPTEPPVPLGVATTAKKPLQVAAQREEGQQQGPTYLVLHFPPGSILPSVPFLKARLVRFGPLDPSGCRVTWRTRTCQVLFRRRGDAARACKHASSEEGSRRMFGPVKVDCSLVEANASALPGFGDVTPPILKPCLKQQAKMAPGKEEGRGGMRVKFMLEEENKEELCGRGGGGNGNEIVDTHAAATSPTTAARKEKEGLAAGVAEQMLGLLWRCHGVVTGVQTSLGYMPYHPL